MQKVAGDGDESEQPGAAGAGAGEEDSSARRPHAQSQSRQQEQVEATGAGSGSEQRLSAAVTRSASFGDKLKSAQNSLDRRSSERSRSRPLSGAARDDLKATSAFNLDTHHAAQNQFGVLRLHHSGSQVRRSPALLALLLLSCVFRANS